MKDLAARMKTYEFASRHFLTQNSALIVRVDGKAFHSYTRHCSRPFDESLIGTMIHSAWMTATQIQGFKLGYVQSDEVSFLLTDFDTIQTQGWFGYNLQKIVSVSASLMTGYFNQFAKSQHLFWAQHQIANFDSRAFIIPQSDIANYFLWRAKDWERNSIFMYARAFFSHKELHQKNQSDIHEMLHSIGKNWAEDLDNKCKNGSFFTFNESFANIFPSYQLISNLVDSCLDNSHSS